jgi:hypothetical protein
MSRRRLRWAAEFQSHIARVAQANGAIAPHFHEATLTASVVQAVIACSDCGRAFKLPMHLARHLKHCKGRDP